MSAKDAEAPRAVVECTETPLIVENDTNYPARDAINPWKDSIFLGLVKRTRSALHPFTKPSMCRGRRIADDVSSLELTFPGGIK